MRTPTMVPERSDRVGRVPLQPDRDGVITIGARRNKLPVIVIPGILGSRLIGRDGSMVWNPGGRLTSPLSTIALAPLSPGGAVALEVVNQLAFGSDPGTFTCDGDVLANSRAALRPAEHDPDAGSEHAWRDDIPGAWGLMGQFYGPVLQWLADSPDYQPYAFPYDWRQDNRQSALALRRVVERALAETNFRKVAILAHSMGGLVARYYCKYFGGRAKVGQLVLFGSPTRGAPKAYRLLRGGLDGSDLLEAFLSLFFRDGRRAVASWPSLYQLLPRTAADSGSSSGTGRWLSWDTLIGPMSDRTHPLWDDYNGGHTSIEAGLPDMRGRIRTNVTTAWRFTERLKDFAHQPTAVVCRSTPGTPGRFDLVSIVTQARADLRQTGTYDGDGSVPFWSASRDSLPRPRIDPHMPTEDAAARQKAWTYPQTFADAEHDELMTHRGALDGFVTDRLQELLEAEVFGDPIDESAFEIVNEHRIASRGLMGRGRWIQLRAVGRRQPDRKVWGVMDYMDLRNQGIPSEAPAGPEWHISEFEYSKIVGRPEPSDVSRADREVVCALLAARDPQVERVFLGSEAYRVLWGRYSHRGGEVTNVDVVAVRRDGRFWIGEGKSNIGDGNGLTRQLVAAIVALGGPERIHRVQIVCLADSFGSENGYTLDGVQGYVLHNGNRWMLPTVDVPVRAIVVSDVAVQPRESAA